jgi:hypothetical protein
MTSTNHALKCAECDGEGELDIQHHDGSTTVEDCSECHSTGHRLCDLCIVDRKRVPAVVEYDGGHTALCAAHDAEVIADLAEMDARLAEREMPTIPDFAALPEAS